MDSLHDLGTGLATVASAIASLPDRIANALITSEGYNPGNSDVVDKLEDVKTGLKDSLDDIRSDLQDLSSAPGMSAPGANNTVGGACASAFTCQSDDPVECAVALDQFKTNCQLTANNPLTLVGQSALQNSGSADDGNPLRTPETVDVSSMFEAPTVNATSCPVSAQFSLMGANYVFDMSGVCAMFSAGGYFVLLMAAFAALKIIGA